jgi:hypothetical protein
VKVYSFVTESYAVVSGVKWLTTSKTTGHLKVKYYIQQPQNLKIRGTILIHGTKDYRT